MRHLSQTYGVQEFHIEDVDPTILDQRIREICQGLIEARLNVQWKLCSGTKVETIRSPELIALMAKAGCNYISISPESGSPRLLKLMDKSFNIDHAKTMIQKMSEEGVYSQACFILGFPEETDTDRTMTKDLVRELARLGLDEVAIFIVTPIPGSDIYKEFSGYNNYSQLTFSPNWRQDYAALNRFRLRLYALFLFTKLTHWPGKMLAQPWRFLCRRFKTKMEMTPYRAMHTLLLRAGVIGHRLCQPQ